MITRVQLTNFGPIEKVDWAKLGQINLVIGGNGSGKTFLLKALYSAMRTLEEYKRGDVQRTAAEILVEKLQWTFQADKIGDLVTKGTDGQLDFRLIFGGNDFAYTFGKDTTKQISSLENHVPPRASNSIFLPAKEVLSLLDIILKSREVDKVFGFDDTYLDLARALRQSGRGGRNYEAFAKSRQNLEGILGGKVEDVDGTGKWLFRKGKHRFPLGVTAEGVKKIAILDTLLSNRYLDPQSIVFIDEVESALHPVAISKLLDIVAALAICGIQFVLASHSYFVVKKLFLIAQEQDLHLPVISSDEKGWHCADLKDGMPDNPIITESIRLYEEEVNLSLE
ncbi:MAG: AAA family ATPase [Verrucomicrobiota bacterium]|nr:AAA family ATPase [Verrucomicrobiota bacterium]